MAKTRGVFALILNFVCKTVFLSERQDNKGWNLPGGRVEKISKEGESDVWESDEQALLREVFEETQGVDPETGKPYPGSGLHIRIVGKIGPDHVFGDDTAVAYLCFITEGTAHPSSEAKCHRSCTEQEVRQQYWRYAHKEFMDGVAMTSGYEKVPIKLVGPEGRLGRTGRMVWDGISLFALPELPTEGDVTVSEDGTQLIYGGQALPRLDPYSPTGRMEPKA